MKNCTRCGECCVTAKCCDIHGWMIHGSPKFEGSCPQLEMVNGVATCKGIQFAFEHPENWYEKTRKWLTETFVGRRCELTKEKNDE